jgi:4-amino-4-deoxy-L-arabinose transferase-like glycosyltransferase
VPDREGTGATAPAIAWRGLGALAVAYFAVLALLSDGYGYHRDELYFIAVGGHPAFGYVDQPPLVPLLAHAMDAISGHSLVVLRLPAALAGALVVLVTGLIARAFGGNAAAQCLAAAGMAAASVLAATAHVTSTTIFDLLGWTVLSWLIATALRADGRIWLLVGLAAGIDLEIKTLPIFFLFALFLGVVAVGPRNVLASRWLWLAALIALAIWLPNLVWQAGHGWPQLELSSSVASGNSTSSQPRSLFVPFQFLLISPLLAPVLIAGLVRLFRDPSVRDFRFLGWAWVILAVVFMASGGKPYYLAGLLPVLLGAGSAWVDAWLERGRATLRMTALGGAVALSAAVGALISLPVLPARDAGPVIDVNEDVGETIGWPEFARTVASVYRELPSGQDAVILTGN